MDRVELVRRQTAAYNRGDWEAALEGVSPEVVWVVARVEEYLEPQEARDAV